MKKSKLLETSIILSSLIVVGALFYTSGTTAKKTGQSNLDVKNSKAEKILEESYSQKVIPEKGVVLPAKWGDLGAKMASVGIIDKIKFEETYASRGGLSDGERKLLESLDNGYLKITPENSGFILNLLWALGLGNKNPVLEQGPMNDPQYGGAGRFASTGGWTLAAGDPEGIPSGSYGAGTMNHYSRHLLIILTEEQQKLVEKVSKNIYRPCCGNSTYFPDCNHGMAMLGLLELMASQGVLEEEMYKAALAANSYWFPSTYITIAKYLKSQGKDWNTAVPKEILGYNYSSGPGYQKLLEKIENPEIKSGGGCSV